ncbi:hypothetical protein [Intestinibacter sp.]
MITLIIWLICAVACSTIANNKGQNPILWFLIGLLFGIFGLGVVLFIPNKYD